MNSKKSIYKLGRTKSHRDSLKRGLVTDLIIYEHMRTTRAKAQAIIPLFHQVVGYSKLQPELARRRLEAVLTQPNAIDKLLDILKPRFEKEKGGLIKMYKLGRRPGDNAEMVKIMLKGYVYKEIGKSTKKVSKKDAEEKEVKTAQPKAEKEERSKKQTVAKSQVANAASQAKVKTRSGI